ncbi:SIS domain-containing protein [Nitrosopumilus sp.]|jgi:D-sedoheptulose 7-phosphate isomerase|nr:SIS domain-containing protein [Nitrosopumilus sp.]
MKSETLNNNLIQQFDDCIKLLTDSKFLIKSIMKSSKLISLSLKNKNKLVSFGNGGSAADAQHFAAEFVGRFQKERRSLPAIAFTTDTSILTSIGNDYSFDKIFERQCESLVSKGDIVLAISTSGKSKNVLSGVKMAKKNGAKIICLTGSKTTELVKISDISIQIPSNSTPRIQEVHRLILHLICDSVEQDF